VSGSLARALVAVAFVVGCGGGEAAPQPGDPAAPTVVEPVLVVSMPVDETWSFPGKVRALERAKLAAPTEGTLSVVEKREGEAFEAGDLLVQIDTSVLEARVDAARARVDAAGAEINAYERAAGQLLAAGAGGAEVAGAHADAEAARGRLRGLRAEAQAMAVELVAHELRAPFAGVVVARHADPGDWVRAGTPVLDILSNGRLEVVVDAPAQALGAIAVDERASVLGVGVAPAVVVGVVPAVDPETGRVRVRVEPVEPPTWLLPGATVGVRLPLEDADAELPVVPRSAVAETSEGQVVFRLVDGRSVPVKVSVLASREDLVLVESADLAVGDQVARQGGAILGGLVVEKVAEPKP
jgi:RND family efflux transporter MFP subunit